MHAHTQRRSGAEALQRRQLLQFPAWTSLPIPAAPAAQEGTTFGTDASSELKRALMAENREKFRRKWEDVLQARAGHAVCAGHAACAALGSALGAGRHGGSTWLRMPSAVRHCAAPAPHGQLRHPAARPFSGSLAVSLPAAEYPGVHLSVTPAIHAAPCPLQSQHCPASAGHLVASGRYRAPRVLWVDDVAPEPDRDSGENGQPCWRWEISPPAYLPGAAWSPACNPATC